jgi:hypothetical protein
MSSVPSQLAQWTNRDESYSSGSFTFQDNQRFTISGVTDPGSDTPSRARTIGLTAWVWNVLPLASHFHGDRYPPIHVSVYPTDESETMVNDALRPELELPANATELDVTEASRKLYEFYKAALLESRATFQLTQYGIRREQGRAKLTSDQRHSLAIQARKDWAPAIASILGAKDMTQYRMDPQPSLS